MPGHVTSTCGMPVELHVWISLSLKPHLDIWIRNVADTVLLERRNILFIRAKLNTMKYKCWPLHFRVLMGPQEKILTTENISFAGLCDSQGMYEVTLDCWPSCGFTNPDRSAVHFQCKKVHTLEIPFILLSEGRIQGAGQAGKLPLISEVKMPLF